MKTAIIEAIHHYTALDGKQFSQIDATLNYPIEYGRQPSLVSWISKTPGNVKVGDSIETSNDEFNFLYMLDNGKFGSWEFLGSDHNSVVAYYGPSHEIDSIMLQIQHSNQQIVSETSSDELEAQSICTFRWDMDNDMSLCFHYIDEFYGSYDEHNVKSKNVISALGGGHTDDILLFEVLSYPLAKLTKKIKLAHVDNEDLDNFQNYEYYLDAIQVDGKQYKKEETLLLGLGQAIFCDLLNWHQTSEEEVEDENSGIEDEFDINLMALAQKIQVLCDIKQLVPPTTTSEIRMTFENDESSKEYLVRFGVQENNYLVQVSYGKIGSTLKTETKYQGADLALAQKEYLSIVSEKLTKGYVQQNSLNAKLKM